MKETTRSEIWSVLNRAFGWILCALQESVPGVKMEAGHYRNDAFEFRGYAEYSVCECVLVISFNIQARGGQLHVWGDIAQEDGFVLRDIMDTTSEHKPDGENGFVEVTGQFAADCKKELQLIENALRAGPIHGRPKPHGPTHD